MGRGGAGPPVGRGDVGRRYRFPRGLVAVGADEIERAEEQGVGQAQELREAAARAPRVREQRRREPRSGAR